MKPVNLPSSLFGLSGTSPCRTRSYFSSSNALHAQSIENSLYIWRSREARHVCSCSAVTRRRHHLSTRPVSWVEGIRPLRHQSQIRSRTRTSIRWHSQVTTRTGSATHAGDAEGQVSPHATALPDTQPCTVKVLDYADKQLVEHEVSGTKDGLDAFLRDNEKPAWAACRWIYVNGIDQGIVKSLGAHKNLHRLAIEDILERSAPTKVDWYSNHCFVVLSWQRLVKAGNKGVDHAPHARSLWDDTGDVSLERYHPLRDEIAQQSQRKRRLRWCSTPQGEFGMSSEHVAVFLTSDNTLITLFESSGETVLDLILHHLTSSRTILRSSNDPSMLLHAIIDAVVDLAVPIERAVHDAFADLEAAVLDAPSIAQSKELYRLRSALTVLMDDIAAIGAVVKSICDHQSAPALPTPEDDPMPKDALVPISPLAKVYLQDVDDHVTMLANSTQRGIHSAENLTSLIFNTIAAGQNASVRRLTVVSIFFLPLTFLTGYFGMNFDPMPIVQEHSDQMFWVIATPVMLVTLVVFSPRPRWVGRVGRWMRGRKA